MSSSCCQQERLNVSNILPRSDVIAGPPEATADPESARPQLLYPESLLLRDLFRTILCFHSWLHYITLFIFPVWGPNISRQLNNPPRSLEPRCVHVCGVRVFGCGGGSDYLASRCWTRSSAGATAVISYCSDGVRGDVTGFILLYFRRRQLIMGASLRFPRC